MESSMAVKREEPLPRDPGSSESDDDELADELEAELFEAEAKRDLLGDSKRPRNETGSPATALAFCRNVPRPAAAAFRSR